MGRFVWLRLQMRHIAMFRYGRHGRHRWCWRYAVAFFGRRHFRIGGKGGRLTVRGIGQSSAGDGQIIIGRSISRCVHMMGGVIVAVIWWVGMLVLTGKWKCRQPWRAKGAQVLHQPFGAELSHQLIHLLEGTGRLGWTNGGRAVGFDGQCIQMIDKGDVAGHNQALEPIDPLISAADQW